MLKGSDSNSPQDNFNDVDCIILMIRVLMTMSLWADLLEMKRYDAGRIFWRFVYRSPAEPMKGDKFVYIYSAGCHIIDVKLSIIICTWHWHIPEVTMVKMRRKSRLNSTIRSVEIEPVSWWVYKISESVYTVSLLTNNNVECLWFHNDITVLMDR